MALIKPKPIRKHKFTGGIIKIKTKSEFDRDKQFNFIERIRKLIT